MNISSSMRKYSWDRILHPNRACVRRNKGAEEKGQRELQVETSRQPQRGTLQFAAVIDNVVTAINGAVSYLACST